MSDPFIGEIRIFAGNFAPSSWAFCDGQLLPIAQNTALFSIIGTIYGGDGRTTVGLPDLQGRAPMGSGNGPGLTNRPIGSRDGAETETLAQSNMPSHTHQVKGNPSPASANAPDSTMGLARSVGGNAYQSGAPNSTLATGVLDEFAGRSGPHDNMQPHLSLNFIICLSGVFPS